MSEIKNGGLGQYGAGPFEQQQFGIAGVEAVNLYRTYRTENLRKAMPNKKVGYR